MPRQAALRCNTTRSPPSTIISWWCFSFAPQILHPMMISDDHHGAWLLTSRFPTNASKSS
jgi:hypothetical protein